MARSVKKFPYTIGNGNSDQFFKQKASRKVRRLVRTKLHLSDGDETPPLPLVRELSDVWVSAKDGGCSFFGMDKDTDFEGASLLPEYKKLMRK